jgi:hypothetical protein
MTATKTTKRALGDVPAGQADLISGKSAKTLRLTCKAKSPRRPLSAKAQIKETVKQVRAANERAHDARMDACAAAVEAVSPEAAPVAPVAASPREALIKAAEARLRERMTARQVEITKERGLYGEQVAIEGQHVAIAARSERKDVRWLCRDDFANLPLDGTSAIVTFGDTRDQAVALYVEAYEARRTN